VDFEEWLAYKNELHGTEWIVSLSANWETQKTQKNSGFIGHSLGLFQNCLLFAWSTEVIERFSGMVIVWKAWIVLRGLGECFGSTFD
jgi:hypothetical protein